MAEMQASEMREEPMTRAPWQRVGGAAVDSGTLVVGDPCYLGPLDADQLVGPYGTPADWQPRELAAVPGSAATFVRLGNFGGDGHYPVFVRRDGVRVVAALIVFDPTDQSDLPQED